MFLKYDAELLFYSISSSLLCSTPHPVSIESEKYITQETLGKILTNFIGIEMLQVNGT